MHFGRPVEKSSMGSNPAKHHPTMPARISMRIAIEMVNALWSAGRPLTFMDIQREAVSSIHFGGRPVVGFSTMPRGSPCISRLRWPMHLGRPLISENNQSHPLWRLRFRQRLQSCLTVHTVLLFFCVGCHRR